MCHLSYCGFEPTTLIHRRRASLSRCLVTVSLRQHCILPRRLLPYHFKRHSNCSLFNQVFERITQHCDVQLSDRSRSALLEMPPTDDSMGGPVSSSTKRHISTTHTPAVHSPARAATPPPPSERRGFSEARLSDYAQGGRRSSIRGGELNPDAVDSALRREISRQQREGTPGSSPHRKRQRINGDR